MTMQAEAQTALTPEEALIRKHGGDIASAIRALEDLQLRAQSKASKPAVDGPIVIDVDGVSKSYKVGKHTVQALDAVSLQIRQGEYVALTGPSGSGKSTLMQLIGALDRPSSGTLTVNDQQTSKMPDRKLSVFRNQTIGFVFQFFYLQPFLNLERNLEVPGIFARTKRGLRKERATELAESVSLSDRLRHLPNELSGGQMQRAAIARALLNNPAILLADEPTGNLDRENALAIMDLFDAIRTTYGTTVVVVSHDAELAQRADREVRLRDGKVVS